MSTAENVLRLSSVSKSFPVRSKGLVPRTTGHVSAVDDVSLTVRAGTTLGLVGESGCGKSTLGRIMTKLMRPSSGEIEFAGQDITKMSARRFKPLRRELQMIFQDPYSSLNPRQTVGTIITTPLRVQGIRPEGGYMAEVQRLLQRVGLNPEHYNRYPHEFSGGQRQRIGVARALALNPTLIVADEPVSALDVSVQAQVVNLLADLQQELGLTYVVVAHDLSVVRHMSDDVAVMYLGRIVEHGSAEALYANPQHPYTQALMSAVPQVVRRKKKGASRERILLSGDLPSPMNPPSGCRLRTRCPLATALCAQERPLLRDVGVADQRHQVACHHI